MTFIKSKSSAHRHTDSAPTLLIKTLKALIIPLFVLSLSGCGSPVPQQTMPRMGTHADKTTQTAARTLLAQQLLADDAPSEQFLMWTRTGDQFQTHLVLSQGDRIVAIFSKEGLFVPHEGKPIQLQLVNENLPLCDCSTIDQSGLNEDCHPSSTMEIPNILVFTPQENASPRRLHITPTNQFTNETPAGTVTGDGSIITIMGHTLFVAVNRTVTTCDQPQPQLNPSIVAVDLNSQEITDPVDDETARYIEEEMNPAAAASLGPDSTSKLQFAGLVPTLWPGVGYSFNYKFWRQVSQPIDTDDQTLVPTAMNQEITVPGTHIPKTLRPQVVAPVALRPQLAKMNDLLGFGAITGQAEPWVSFFSNQLPAPQQVDN